MANLYIPYLNPVKFFNLDLEPTDKYQYKHFDDYQFAERVLPWQQPADYVQIWQTTDIITLQFESDFDPIVVTLNDENDTEIIALPAELGLANKDFANTYSFEISMSLADLPTGCYWLKVIAGSGETQETYISGRQYISSVPIPGSICHEYWHSHFHKDVIFETDIKFQYRCMAHTKFLDKPRNDTFYRDQRNNPELLQSKSQRQWPLYYGDEYGITDDEIDFITEIWGCDNVLLDSVSFKAPEGKVEFIDFDNDYAKRGLKIIIEPGINRNSKLFSQTIDLTKKLISTIIVDARMFGDTANQNSANTIPVTNIEIE